MDFEIINKVDIYSIAEIFSHLPLEDRLKMENVCLRWRDASLLAWSDIKKLDCTTDNFKKNQVSQSDIEKIIKLARVNLKKLTLDVNFRSKSIMNACKKAKKLEYLDLNKSRVVIDETIREISVSFEKLTYLDISNNWNLSKDSLTQLKNLKNLKNVLINDVVVPDDEIIQQFHDLKILECAVSLVTDKSIIEIIENSENIERLNVSGSKVTEQVLQFAAEITKKRKKNIVIIVDTCLKAEFNPGLSSFLTIQLI